MGQPTLTAHQLKFMDVFGYLIFPGLLNDRIDRIIEEFEAVFASRGGEHSGKARSSIGQFIDQTEYLSSLLDDPRIDGIFSSLVGPDYAYQDSGGSFYVGDSDWHSDRGWSGNSPETRLYYKMALYLDHVTADTGALRVIPGSHRYGDRYTDDLQAMLRTRPSAETLGMPGSQVPAVVLTSQPGDVVVFNHLTKHGSWGGSNRRRMLDINATARYTEAELPLLQNAVAHYARAGRDSVYGPAMRRTAGPERLVHLEQWLAQDPYLAAEVAKAKATVAEPARG